MNTFLNKTNIVGGGIAALFAGVFGQYWFLFMGFLIANIIDWITGWAASRKEGKESSMTGAKGVVKKVWYWIVILMGFYVGFTFERMGELIGINLDFLNFVGWFVLANYIVNELRSILENLVRLDVNVPMFLIKGLEVTGTLVDKAVGDYMNDDKGVK